MKLTSKLLCFAIATGISLVMVSTADAASVSQIQSNLAAEQRSLEAQSKAYSEFMAQRREKVPITVARRSGARRSARGNCSCCEERESMLTEILTLLKDGAETAQIADVPEANRGSYTTGTRGKHEKAENEYAECVTQARLAYETDSNRTASYQREDRNRINELEAKIVRDEESLNKEYGDHGNNTWVRQAKIRMYRRQIKNAEKEIDSLKNKTYVAHHGSAEVCQDAKSKTDISALAAKAAEAYGPGLSAQAVYEKAKAEFDQNNSAKRSLVNERAEELAAVRKEKDEYIEGRINDCVMSNLSNANSREMCTSLVARNQNGVKFRAFDAKINKIQLEIKEEAEKLEPLKFNSNEMQMLKKAADVERAKASLYEGL